MQAFDISDGVSQLAVPCSVKTHRDLPTLTSDLWPQPDVPSSEGTFFYTLECQVVAHSLISKSEVGTIAVNGPGKVTQHREVRHV